MSAAGDNERAARLSAAELRARLDFDDARLLRECQVDLHRVRGPGGQHRNKTESAVRLHHGPSGIIVTGTERRSQHENKAAALVRLREALALYSRVPVPHPVVWPPSVQLRGRCLRVGERNAAFFHVLGLALDALAEARGQPAEAAALLDVSSSSLVRFLADHGKAWAEANRVRAELGLPALKA